MAEKPTALFIDMDGTVTLNTGDVKLWVLDTMLAGYGVDIDALWRDHKLAGKDIKTIFDLCKDRMSEDKRREFSARYPDYEVFDVQYRELFADKIPQIQIRPGMTELIEEALSAGIPVVIVTNTVEQTTRQIFDHHLSGVSDKIQYMCADNVPQGHQKPSSEHYKAAMRAVEIDPEDKAKVSRCVVIEDTTTGIVAARGAGVKHIFQFKHDGASDIVSDEHVYTIRNITQNLRKLITSGKMFGGLASAFLKAVSLRNKTPLTADIIDCPKPTPII